MKQIKEEDLRQEILDAWSEASVIINQNKQDNKTKFGSRKLLINNLTFDSETEYYRYLELKILEKYGIISDVKFHDKEDRLLIVSNPDVRYFPDFSYVINGEKIIEDTKGMQTPDFIIKKKIVISKIRSGEFNFTFLITRKNKREFIEVERHSKGYSYVKPKKKRKK